ncbi:hypothetical protein VTL71DRAFT_14048 [Oculimacula yallundae]|uniref:Cutinase n=1 Tax=Oculimacula yallundae TaxID=86028 RepID=A0ABR4CMM8_9HELO
MMFLATFFFALPIACASQAVSQILSRDVSNCTETHVFLARGWNEDYPGRQEYFVETICSTVQGTCDYEDILYHSSFDAVYCDSISEGVRNGISQTIDYNERCPDSKLVVSGYSQGAYVVGDMFAGGGGTFGDCTQASNEGMDVESEAGKKVTAILLWGSKRHTASQPYNVFSGAEDNGTYPRPAVELAALKKYTSVIQDYCVHTDPNCAGGSVIPDHWNYFDLYADKAAKWIASQVANNVTAASPSASNSLVEGGVNSTSTSSISTSLSSTQSQSSVSSSATPATTLRSESLTVSTTTAASGTSASSSGGAVATGYQMGILGLAIAGSLAGCV